MHTWDFGWLHIVWREIFNEENLHKFCNFTTIRESFLHENLGMPHHYAISLTFHKSFLRKMLPFYRSMKVFESFPLYGNTNY